MNKKINAVGCYLKTEWKATNYFQSNFEFPIESTAKSILRLHHHPSTHRLPWKKTRIWCWCRLICWWIIWSWDSLLSIEYSLIETKITSCIISNGIGFLKIMLASLEICVCAREAVEETDTVPWHCEIFCRELPSITILSSPLSLAFNCINHIIFTGIWIVYDRTSSDIKHCTVLPGI